MFGEACMRRTYHYVTFASRASSSRSRDLDSIAIAHRPTRLQRMAVLTNGAIAPDKGEKGEEKGKSEK